MTCDEGGYPIFPALLPSFLMDRQEDLANDGTFLFVHSRPHTLLKMPNH